MLEPTNPSFQKQAGEKLTNHARRSFIKADWLARKFNHDKVDNIHLFYAIYLEKGSIGSNILKDFGLRQEDFLPVFKKEESLHKKHRVLATDSLKKTFTRAYGIAKDFDYPYVGTEHLTYALIGASDRNIAGLLSKIKTEDVKKSITDLFDPSQISNIPKIFDMPEFNLSKTSAEKKSAFPFVDKFCADINKEAGEKRETIVGRDTEIGRMINILGRKNKNNPLLVGEPGVGKTALIWGLADRINRGAVPPALYRKKIMSLDVAQLIAGTSFRGEFESRLKEIIKEVSKSKDIILFIDEIHTIIGAGNLSGSLDLANIIKPALARGEIRLIGATTHSEFKKHIEKDAALERRFQPIRIKEPDIQEAEKILFGIRENYEKFHNVRISDDVVRLAIDLSARYIQNRFLPDKAIDIIDEAASNARSKEKISDSSIRMRNLEEERLSILEQKEKLVEKEDYGKAIGLRHAEKIIEEKIQALRFQDFGEKSGPIDILARDIIETVSKISGIPTEKLAREKSGKIKNIRKILAANIIGQDEAIKKLADTLLRSQSGVSDPDRPLGSFLFLGPTGVGKTWTAKILAREYFGDAGSLIRIDMSEFMEKHSVSSLIGSPAGYIGYGEGGNLTEKVRRNPYSVILFDEIEKAHPEVFNILLQILEDGILTDAEGTAVSFKNTIIILTSNIGTGNFQAEAVKVGFELGSGTKKKEIHEKFNEMKIDVLDDLKEILRMELLNRLDHILVFNALGETEIKKIADKELKKLAARISAQNIRLDYKPEITEHIAKKSLSFDQGARLIRKNIRELLENKIAEMIVYDRVRNGKITISLKKEEMGLN